MFKFKNKSVKKKQQKRVNKDYDKTISHNHYGQKDEYAYIQKEAIATSGYERANEKLKPVPYVLRKEQELKNIITVRNMYPYLSIFFAVGTGLFAGDLFASGLSDFGYWFILAVIFIVTFLIFWLLENAKKRALKDVFNPSTLNRPVVLAGGLFLISMATSGFGGFVTSFYLNDNSDLIEKNILSKRDSVNSMYLSQYDALKSTIQENQKRAKDSNKWVRGHAVKDLQKNLALMEKLNSKQENTNEKLETKKTNLQKADEALNKYKSYTIVLIVLIFELLYVRSFAYEYAVERKVRNEGIKLQKIKNEKEYHFEPYQNDNVADDKFLFLVNQLTALLGNQQNTELQQGKIPANKDFQVKGFRLGQNQKIETGKQVDFFDSYKYVGNKKYEPKLKLIEIDRKQPENNWQSTTSLCNQLGVSRTTLYKYMDELIETGRIPENSYNKKG